MIVQQAQEFLGVMGVMDTPRSTAPEVIEELKRLGIQRILMLSGDNQRVADAVASSVGLTEAYGELMPEDKVRTIHELSEHGGVAMVGRWRERRTAMAGATVGIAMGAAGSDVALETADVALMSDNLQHLPFAVGLSRRTRTIIRQKSLDQLRHGCLSRTRHRSRPFARSSRCLARRLNLGRSAQRTQTIALCPKSYWRS